MLFNTEADYQNALLGFTRKATSEAPEKDFLLAHGVQDKQELIKPDIKSSYLTTHSLEKIRNVDVDKAIHVSELMDMSPRTLLFGYNTSGNYIHVYLCSEQLLNIVLTDASNKNVIYHNRAVSFNADEMVPTKRAIPQNTDFEFAVLLAKQGAESTYTTVGDAEQKQFYGLTPDFADKPWEHYHAIKGSFDELKSIAGILYAAKHPRFKKLNLTKPQYIDQLTESLFQTDLAIIRHGNRIAIKSFPAMKKLQAKIEHSREVSEEEVEEAKSDISRFARFYHQFDFQSHQKFTNVLNNVLYYIEEYRRNALPA